MEEILVAVPSEAPGGLEAQAAAHFGHCPVYTLVRVEDGELKEVSVVTNVAHEHGGCLAPVQLLAEKGVKALIAGGMGMRPLAGFQEKGIQVYRAGGEQTVGALVQAWVAGQLPEFSMEATCRGGCHH